MTADDRLLRQLGALAREQEVEPPPPAALLPAPDADRLARLLEGVLPGAPAALRTAPAAVAPAAAPIAPVAELLAPLRRRIARWLAVPVAVAAGAALWMRASDIVLPAYDATISGGIAEQRGAPPAPDRPLLLDPGSPVEIVLRPATAVAAALEARVYFGNGTLLRPWTEGVSIEPSDRGSFRIRGPAARPFGPGPGELILLVAPAGELPSAVTPARVADPPRAWRVVRRPVLWR